MFTLIVKQCVKLLIKTNTSSSNINSRCTDPSTSHPKTGAVAGAPKVVSLANDDFRRLFPSVKVWCDWMLCHRDLWNQPPERLTSPFDFG